MTVYERNAFLYGFESLEGKPATLLYLPTPRARKWRKGWSVMTYSEVAYNNALAIVQSGEIHSFRFVEGML